MALNYEQNFDSLNNGDLAGQDSFYLDGDYSSPEVQDSVKYAGAKAIKGWKEAESLSRINRDFAGVNNGVHWIKCCLRTSNASERLPFVYVGKDENFLSVLFGGRDGYWQAFDGDGAGGGSFVSTSVVMVNDEWIVIKAKINYSTKEWDIYVNDMNVPKLTGLGFSLDSGDSLNWIRLYFASAAYPSEKFLDEVQIHDYDPDNIAILRRRRMQAEGVI